MNGDRHFREAPLSPPRQAWLLIVVIAPMAACYPAIRRGWSSSHRCGLGICARSWATWRSCSYDVRAAEAIALFCYQVKIWIGSFAAALGGFDTLVIAGDIGETASTIRARIWEGLGFLGIEVNEQRNRENAPMIATDVSRVAVRVIRTDEKLMSARSVFPVLDPGAANEKDATQ